MGDTVAIIVYLGGIIAAFFILRLLQRRLSEAVAVGLGFWAAMLAFYPLRQAMGSQLTFIAWAVWCTLVSIVVTIIFARFGSK